MKTHTIELTDRELYLLWVIACWFRKPVTSTLKAKLSGLAGSPLRQKFDALYEEHIQSQMISNGLWLQDYRRKQEEAK